MFWHSFEIWNEHWFPWQVYTGVLRLGPGLCFLYGIGNMRMISFLTAFIFCLLSSSSISLMLHIEPGCEWIRMPNSSFTWLLHSGSIILGMSRCFLFFSSKLFSFEDAFCYQQKDKELNMHMFNICMVLGKIFCINFLSLYAWKSIFKQFPDTLYYKNV